MQKSGDKYEEMADAARTRLWMDPVFHAKVREVEKVVQDILVNGKNLDPTKIAVLSVMVVEQINAQAGRPIPGYELGETSTVYMDGSALYSLRHRGRPGIICNLRLFADDVVRLGMIFERDAP
jgi:hypothetical protein